MSDHAPPTLPTVDTVPAPVQEPVAVTEIIPETPPAHASPLPPPTVDEPVEPVIAVEPIPPAIADEPAGPAAPTPDPEPITATPPEPPTVSAPEPPALPEPNPQPVPEPRPEPISEPKPTIPPQPAPEPTPAVSPATPAPPDHTSMPDPHSTIPPAVLALSDQELRIAAAYYLQKNQTEISRKGVQARQQTMRRNLDAITAYIQAHGSTQIPRLARELNLSPGLTSHYLQILVKQHKVKAEGWAKDRRYSV